MGLTPPVDPLLRASRPMLARCQWISVQSGSASDFDDQSFAGRTAASGATSVSTTPVGG
jgi:hypothetical protein